jgi:hypothetical protein
MKKYEVIFFVFLVCIFSSIAAPPFITQSASSGQLQIEYPKIAYFRNTNITLNFHVYNSTGYILNNKTTDCYFHLYNNTGNHVLNGQIRMYFDNSFDYEEKIGSDLISYGQVYSYVVQCNNTQEAGFVSANFYVNNLNSPITTGYWLLLLVPFLFALLCMFGAATLGDQHAPLRIFLFLLSIISCFATCWIATLILYQDNANFVEMIDALGLFTKIIGFMFFVILIYFIIYLFVKMVQASNQEKDDKLNYGGK